MWRKFWSMTYSKKLLDHYEKPRNVGSMDKENKDVLESVIKKVKGFMGYDK